MARLAPLISKVFIILAMLASVVFAKPGDMDLPSNEQGLLVDPSMPAGFLLQSFSESEEDEVGIESLILQGIFKIGHQSKAVINGISYKSGDKITGFTITDINKYTIYVEDQQGVSYEIALNRPFKADLMPKKPNVDSEAERIAYLINDKYTTVQIIKSETSTSGDAYEYAQKILKSYQQLSENLTSCTPNASQVSFPAKQLESKNKQEILGWQADESCLVIHQLGLQKAECHYRSEQLTQLAANDSEKKLLDGLTLLFKRKDNYDKNLKTVNLILPSYCRLV